MATCIPALGCDATIPSRARLTEPSGVCERYGIVWVSLERARVALPGWPDGDDDLLGEFSPIAHTSMVLAAYQTDNLLDSSHFPFLHGSLSARNPLASEQEIIDQHEFGFSTVQRKLGDDDTSTEGWLRYSFVAPFTVLLRSEEPDGSLRQSFFQAVQPIDSQRTRLFFIVRVPETDPVILAAMLAEEEGVQREDLWITAALRRTGMPLAGAPDLHVRSDGNAILYRRVMRRLLDAAGSSGE
jgi:phenylpropionate dioxygenase-like ring-hydroxylating dioxygenase large terminal subunit